MNIKIEHTICQLVSFVFYKVLIFSFILYFYNFTPSNKCFIYDLFITILAICFICIFTYFRSNLLKNIEKLNNKNESLINKLKNIFNTMKSPLISINLKKNVVLFNYAFIDFIKQNYKSEINEIDYLFDEKNDLNENVHEDYFNSIYENISKTDKLYFETAENKLKSLKNVKNLDIFFVYRKKILILYKILSSFHLETNVHTVNVIESFDIFELIREKRIFEEKENFDNKGTYKITNSKKIVEISWRNTLYSKNEQVIYIMFQDLT